MSFTYDRKTPIIKIYLMSIAVYPQYSFAGEGAKQSSWILLFAGLIDKLICYAKDGRRQGNAFSCNGMDSPWSASLSGSWNERSRQHTIYEIDLDQIPRD